MINYHTNLVSALNNILPTHYEMALTETTQIPCISYMERNNYTTDNGDTMAYSRVSYTVKIWGNDIAQLQDYAIKVDAALHSLGFKRLSSGELYDNQSTMIQKILTYEALALENY